MPEKFTHSTDRLTLSERERWGRNIIRYDALAENGEHAGNVDLLYRRKSGRVILNAVELDEAFRGQGLGKEIYRAIPSLPTPDGQSFQEAGYTFNSSSDLSKNAEAVWQSLVHSGEAIALPDGSYQMIDALKDSGSSDTK